MTAFRIINNVIWVQNMRFIAKIGPKLKGKRQKNTNTKKTQVPDIIIIIFFKIVNFKSADLHVETKRKGSPNWPWPGWSPWSMAQPYSSLFSSVI